MVLGCSSDCCARLAYRHQSSLSFWLLVAGYVLYLVIGAGIFSAIELPYESQLLREVRAARRDFLSNNTCVSDARLEELLARALDANSFGVSVLGNHNNSHGWDFVSSLFFTSTVLTTTGYGHTVPLSDEGKAFCIFYSLLGVPITLFFLSVVVQRLMVVVSRRPVSYFHRRWAISRSKMAAIHATCLTLIMALLFLIIPAWIFFTLEKDWNYLESLYFCFISLTTIGLGDYVPGESHDNEPNPHPNLYKLGVTIYLLLGLVFILVVLETCFELPQMRSIRQRFYQEDAQDLDSETANIIEPEDTSDEVNSTSTTNQQSAIRSVSELAASLRQGGIATYTPATGSTVPINPPYMKVG
ncbi:potassium channel subfamily K member 1-like [Gouania willdenowi]|uniref:Potassium channel subfamily K member n=1 Tax=Gouania willdenowi TaxID=441366 RepID=A0A8C5HW97_GOUWI|nr:potassium channel subfamily K member 1-like [Gouania willdenowi]